VLASKEDSNVQARHALRDDKPAKKEKKNGFARIEEKARPLQRIAAKLKLKRSRNKGEKGGEQSRSCSLEELQTE